MKQAYKWLHKSRIILGVFPLFSLLVFVFAHYYNASRKSELKQGIEEDLQTIAELKAEEI